jgi:hypothetical protein
MKDQFTDELRTAIADGFVLLDRVRRIAIVGANMTSLPDTAEGILALLKRTMGLQAELTMRHGYTAVSTLS